MSARPSPIPLRPDPTGIRELSMRSLSRAAVAIGLQALDGGLTPSQLSPADFMRRRDWETDRVGMLVTRAASSPAMLGTSGWATELGTVALAFLETLKPMSAGAQLLGQALSVSFDSAAQVRLPSITPGSAQFVAEGQPIRVSQLPTTAGPTMSPFKLASIVELTREMLEGSNAEQFDQDGTCAAVMMRSHKDLAKGVRRVDRGCRLVSHH
jgi:hypothetical protein